MKIEIDIDDLTELLPKYGFGPATKRENERRLAILHFLFSKYIESFDKAEPDEA